MIVHIASTSASRLPPQTPPAPPPPPPSIFGRFPCTFASVPLYNCVNRESFINSNLPWPNNYLFYLFIYYFPASVQQFKSLRETGSLSISQNHATNRSQGLVYFSFLCVFFALLLLSFVFVFVFCSYKNILTLQIQLK